MEIPREDLLRVQEKNKENITPFISTYNPKNKEAFDILKNNMEILKNDETMRTILNNTKVIKSKRQLPNLKRLLVKSEFKEINIVPSVSKCNEPRCGLCNYIIEGSSLNLNNKVSQVKENMNCNIKKNVLYVLICNGSREYYFGRRETNFETDGQVMTNKSGTQNNYLSVLI